MASPFGVAGSPVGTGCLGGTYYLWIGRFPGEKAGHDGTGVVGKPDVSFEHVECFRQLAVFGGQLEDETPHFVGLSPEVAGAISGRPPSVVIVVGTPIALILSGPGVGLRRAARVAGRLIFHGGKFWSQLPRSSVPVVLSRRWDVR